MQWIVYSRNELAWYLFMLHFFVSAFYALVPFFGFNIFFKGWCCCSVVVGAIHKPSDLSWWEKMVLTVKCNKTVKLTKQHRDNGEKWENAMSTSSNKGKTMRMNVYRNRANVYAVANTLHTIYEQSIVFGRCLLISSTSRNIYATKEPNHTHRSEREKKP